MAYLFICMPLAMAALAAAIRSNRWRPWLLPAAGVVHAALMARLLVRPAAAAANPWLALDPPGRLILLVVSLLFLCCSFYAVGYLQLRQERPNRVFCCCCLVFLGIAGLAASARHLGLLWVAIEATTLTTVPLIYFNHTPRSIEATWKYLLVGSVGIALALLGTFFLAYAALHAGVEPSLMQADLLEHAPRLSKPWLRAAFALLLGSGHFAYKYLYFFSVEALPVSEVIAAGLRVAGALCMSLFH